MKTLVDQEVVSDIHFTDVWSPLSGRMSKMYSRKPRDDRGRYTALDRLLSGGERDIVSPLLYHADVYPTDGHDRCTTKQRNRDCALLGSHTSDLHSAMSPHKQCQVCFYTDRPDSWSAALRNA
jgi:hypothetical protein